MCPVWGTSAELEYNWYHASKRACNKNEDQRGIHLGCVSLPFFHLSCFSLLWTIWQSRYGIKSWMDICPFMHLLFYKQTICKKRAKARIVHLQPAWSSCVLSLCHSPTQGKGVSLSQTKTRGWRKSVVKNSQYAFPCFLNHRKPSTLKDGEFKLCFENSPLSAVSSIICPHQGRKWVRRRWAQGEEEEGVERANGRINFKTHTLSKKLLQAVHDYEYKLSVTYCLSSPLFRDHMWWDPVHQLMRSFRPSTRSIPATQQPGLWRWSLFSER